MDKIDNRERSVFFNTRLRKSQRIAGCGRYNRIAVVFNERRGRTPREWLVICAKPIATCGFNALGVAQVDSAA